MCIILVVDDDDEIRMLIGRMLRDKGLAVMEADGGDAALAVASAPGMRVRVMVTDVEMPDMGGRELAVRMRALHPAVRLIYMTGLSKAAIEKSGPLEADAVYLGKPFNPAELLAAVGEAG